MPRLQYIHHRFGARASWLIETANSIIEEYRAQGFELTLRQLYYQFVSRDIIPNNQREYKNLGSLINDARLAGLVDWNAIIDRTRNLRTLQHWNSPFEIMKAVSFSYREDKWSRQSTRVEVWIEKDALVGVIEEVCNTNDVPFFSCRGYVSQSELWAASQRFNGYQERGQEVLVLHFGDHDPSGIDMTRDITDRLALFSDDHQGVSVERMALHYAQVKALKLPPNPAKLTDSRSRGYIAAHGSSSWELDALEPKRLVKMIQQGIDSVRDEAEWEEAIAREEKAKAQLQGIAQKLRK